MAVEVNISKATADYYLEAYTKDYKINEDKTIEDIGQASDANVLYSFVLVDFVVLCIGF